MNQKLGETYENIVNHFDIENHRNRVNHLRKENHSNIVNHFDIENHRDKVKITEPGRNPWHIFFVIKNALDKILEVNQYSAVDINRILKKYIGRTTSLSRSFLRGVKNPLQGTKK